MNKIILIGLFSFIATYTYSQNKWELIEVELGKQKLNQSISLEDWYLALQKEAGVIPNRLSAWHNKTSNISAISNKGISLFFVKEYLNITSNGNVYRKMILQNDSSDSLNIERIDAAIGGLKEFFLIEGSWKEHRQNGLSECGNSYYNQILKPYSQIDFELSNGGLNNGEVEIDYKISITINEQTYYSNIIKVNLYENQFKRIKKHLTVDKK